MFIRAEFWQILIFFLHKKRLKYTVLIVVGCTKKAGNTFGETKECIVDS